MFLINSFIFISFKNNFNIFLYTYIAIFNILSLINLIFIKKLRKFILLYNAISLSSFSLVLFIGGLEKLNEILSTNHFINLSIIFIIIYILIIVLSINHIKNFYTSTSYRNKFLRNSPTCGLIVSFSILGINLSKTSLNPDLIISIGLLLIGCGLAVCYSQFYKFFNNYHY